MEKPVAIVTGASQNRRGDRQRRDAACIVHEAGEVAVLS